MQALHHVTYWANEIIASRAFIAAITFALTFHSACSYYDQYSSNKDNTL